MSSGAVRMVLDCFPRIFHACHRRHVRDDKTRQLLSSHQASVLDHLDAVEPMNLKALAAHLGVKPSAMSLMIDRLERGGFVRRSADARDARRVGLRLTKAGERIKRQQKVLDPDRVAQMLRRLNAKQRKAALEGLQLLARAASEVAVSTQKNVAKWR